MESNIALIQEALDDSGLLDYNIDIQQDKVDGISVYYLVATDEVPPFRLATIYENVEMYNADLVSQIFADTAFVQDDIFSKFSEKLEQARDDNESASKLNMLRWIAKEISRKRQKGKQYDDLLDVLLDTVGKVK